MSRQHRLYASRVPLALPSLPQLLLQVVPVLRQDRDGVGEQGEHIPELESVLASARFQKYKPC